MNNEKYETNLNINQEPFPESLISWFIWTLPKNFWRKIAVWAVVVFITLFAVIGYWQLIKIRDSQILNIKKQIFEEQWNYSEEPIWKSALITVWKDSIIPQKNWEIAANHHSSIIRLAVARHKCSPSDWRDRLAEGDHSHAVRLAAIFNRADYKRIISLLTEITDDEILKALLSRTNFHIEFYNKILKKHSSKELKKALASNPRCPGELLQEMAQEEELLYQVVSNPGAPTNLLTEHSQNSNLRIRQAVAANPSTPDWLLRNLSRDISKSDLFFHIAKNPEIPIEAIHNLLESEKLLKKDFFKILEQIVLNPRTPSQILKKYAIKEKPNLKKQIASNPNTPTDILKIIANNIQLRLASKPEIKEFSRITYLKIIAKIAENRNTESSLLKDFSRYANRDILKAIASNPNTPSDILFELSKNREYIRMLANNQNTPKDLLEKWAKYQDRVTRKEIAKNTGVATEILEYLANDNDIDVRKAISENPSTPPKTLFRLLSDSSKVVAKEALIRVINFLGESWERPEFY